MYTSLLQFNTFTIYNSVKNSHKLQIFAILEKYFRSPSGDL